MKEKGIRFVAYLSPPQENVYENLKNPNCITDEHYRNMCDCGFDYAIGLFEDKEKYYRQAMEMCRKFGVKYFVRDQFEGKSLEWIIDDRGKNGTPEELLDKNADVLKTRFDSYREFPAFFGLLASDEPCADKFPAIRTVSEWFYRNCPNVEFEVNLLPIYASSEQLSGFPDKRYSYTQYLDDYVRIVEPRTLSYDFYALGKNDKTGELTINPDYLYNLELVAHKAKEIGVPFYTFLQTIGHWSFRTIERYSELAWQVYTALAFGAGGAQTFTYWTLLGDHEKDGSRITHGVVGQNGELTNTYFACKETIAEVRAFEKEYATFKWLGARGVNADADNPNPMISRLKNEIGFCGAVRGVKTTGDVVIGFFGKPYSSAILVSNVTDPTPDTSAEVTIFVSAKEATVYYGGTKTVRDVSSGELKLTLRGGSGAFVIFKG